MTNKILKAKARKGIVSLFLHDSTGTKQDRRFVLDSKRFYPIPEDYAISMIESANVQALIRKGVIILEDEEEYVEKAKEEGYATEESLEKIDREAIKETLLKNNITKIKELFNEENSAEAKIALEIARENADEMSSAAIRTIENITKVSIQPEEA